MLYALLFSFYVNGMVITIKVADTEDLATCKALGFQAFKLMKVKPDHIFCARKA